MSLDPARIPVLVGIGQSIERDEVTNVVALASRAAKAAFEDAPGLADKIQRLTMVAVSFSPVGLAPATEVAEELGLSGVECETGTPGGNSPQWLMNRACHDISTGEIEANLIVGAEATRSMRLADPDSDFLRAATQDRSGEAGPRDNVVGPSIRGMLGKAELDANLLRPADTYPIFESALAAKLESSAEESRRRIAAFMSRSSEVAAKNPFAWFPQVRSAEEISQASPTNRITAEPYTKRMNSFANVDQGSALLVTSLALAKAAGLADQCVFPWSGASNAELVPSARTELGGSPAIRAAAKATFAAAGLGLDDIDFIDLYSCFPVAVEIGAAEIGLALDDERGLTQTGGMSFFGGPGNNYTSHGIAAVALRLRETGDSGRFGYASGNGGILSKHSLGIYGSEPPANGFKLADTSSEQAEIMASAIEVVHEAEGETLVDGGTVVYDRAGNPAAAPIIASLADGRRVVAVAGEETLPTLAGRTLVGESVRVTGANPPVYSV
jgi:acetyl-CoA C-acetyltransferase